VGPDVTYTSTSFKYGYEDGNRFSGKIAYAPIGFPDASEPIVTDVPIAFGVIDKVTCKDGPGTCPGMGAERVGVMGVRYFNDAENGIFNPFAFLPGNLSSGFMVAANGPTPTVIVGLTPENTQGFLFTNIEPDGGAGRRPLCLGGQVGQHLLLDQRRRAVMRRHLVRHRRRQRPVRPFAGARSRARRFEGLSHPWSEGDDYRSLQPDAD